MPAVTLLRLFLILLALPLVPLGLSGCDRSEAAGADAAPPAEYVVTIHPLKAILDPLVGDRATVSVLLAPGASPHTYAPRPSDVRKVHRATGFFYVADNLDGWAAGMDGAERVSVLGLLPREHRLANACLAHGHVPHVHGTGVPEAGQTDAHFWMDPQAVRAVVPGLVDQLARLDPKGAAQYRANGEAFATHLGALDAQLREKLEPLRGAPVVLFHPSVNYLLERYGLEFAGVVEPFPGKQATPRYLSDLAGHVRAQGARAIFTEPQLNAGPAKVLAETAGLALHTLDPVGGVPGRYTYDELLHYNAQTLRDALGDG